ncbi:MAG: regulatory protein afsR [Verrucomicrobiota bacterium]
MPTPADSPPPPTGPFELFLSYARKDNAPRHPGDARGWVETLRDEILARHRRFSTAPLAVHPFYDMDDIKGMDDWRHKILAGIRQSKILLVCLSPDYFKSDNCLWEWEEFHRHKASRLVGHESVAPVYFVEAPGSDEQATAAFEAFVRRGHYRAGELEKFIPRWREWHAAIRRFNHYDFRPWFPAGSAALAEDDVKRRLDELAGQLTDRVARTRRAADAPGNLREYNPHFVGRAKQLVALHETLLRDGAVGVVTAVNGLGGQGKTEFAISYAHSHADSFPGGLWVLEAEGRTEILPLLGQLAGDARFGIPPSAGPEETAAQRGVRVLVRLKEQARAAAARDRDGGAACLLILDNVSVPALLSKTQRALLPAEDWLRVVATTRLGPADFGTTPGAIAFHEMSSLDEDDAVDLLRNHQPPRDPDGRRPDFAVPAEDEPAARAIVCELGCFTLEVERVAVHLGLNPTLRPADYLAHLRAAGLVSVDALPLGATGEDELHHREKRLALVLDQTLAPLGAAERAALDYAALLPPDSVPWPWLEALVEQDHADALAARPGEEEPWAKVRRRLEGLRLLTPGEHPEVARLHRMVAAHVRARLGERAEQRARVLRGKVEDFALTLQESSRHDPATLWEVAHIAGVVGTIEQEVGRLDVAEEFLRLYHEVTERSLSANPQSAQAARDVSVSLERLGDFLASRGQSGDAAQALKYYERSLEVREALLAANPQSAQAARDVAAGLQRLGDFRTARGLPGDAEEALRCYERCLQVTEKLLAANPDSADAARNVSVSLNKLADFLARRGQTGDAAQALKYYERNLKISEALLAANPQSAQAARDLAISLERMSAVRAKQAGPAAAPAALALQRRSLELSLGLFHSNRGSVFYGRTAAVSFSLTYQRAQAAGDEAAAREALAGCHAVLKELIAGGAQLDAAMVGLYGQLERGFPPSP